MSYKPLWKLTKRFLRDYIALFVASLVCFEHPWVQRLLVMTWILLMGRVAYDGRKNNAAFVSYLQSVGMSQLPGIILVLVSWSRIFGKFNEWPNAVVEIWYHPFICVIETFPLGYVGNWSDLYVETCLIPVGIIIISAIMWRAMVMIECQFGRRARRPT